VADQGRARLHRGNLPTIRRLIPDSVAFQTSNTGRIVFRGAYPWPPFPRLLCGPDVDAATADMILEDPPCGYFLTEAQYSGQRPEGTVERRLRLHGIAVERAPGYIGQGPGYLVRMTQPLPG
jgi:hypothetical protein